MESFQRVGQMLENRRRDRSALNSAPILTLHLDQKLSPEEADFAGRINADLGLRALDREDEYLDIRADENALTGSTGHDEHQLCRVNGHHPPGSFSSPADGWVP